MIGAVLTFAILILQVHYHLIPSDLTIAALKSFFWPYVVLIFLFITASVLTAAVKLDNERASEIASVEATIESAQQRVAAPTLPALERSRRERVAERLEDFNEDERNVLNYIRQHGRVEQGQVLRIGFSGTVIAGATRKGVASGLVIRKLAQRQGHPDYWEINPELKDALAFHLLGE